MVTSIRSDTTMATKHSLSKSTNCYQEINKLQTKKLVTNKGWMKQGHTFMSQHARQIHTKVNVTCIDWMKFGPHDFNGVHYEMLQPRIKCIKKIDLSMSCTYHSIQCCWQVDWTWEFSGNFSETMFASKIKASVKVIT